MEFGGYFELELRKGVEYHPAAINLNTGCNAFKYILKVKRYKKVYLPYFTCTAMLNPIHTLGLRSEFYHINDQFEPVFDFTKIKQHEAFVYTNYFGIFDKVVEKLAGQCPNLIIDNAQAFYSKPIPDIDTFYSARKFFGVPDGAYLYSNNIGVVDLPSDVSLDRFAHLLKRIEFGPEAGYQDFHINNMKLDNQLILKMSKLTQALLCGIDYEEVKKRRRTNYLRLQKKLSDFNILKLSIDDYMVPMVYPFLANQKELKQKLIEERIYIATYWPNVLVWAEKSTIEYRFAEYLIPLPIDQRLGPKEINYIIERVKRNYR